MSITHEERARILRVMILKILDECGSYLLAEHTLFVQLNLELAPPASTAEFRSALDALSSLRAIASIRPELGGNLQWKITAAGRLILAENR